MKYPLEFAAGSSPVIAVENSSGSVSLSEVKGSLRISTRSASVRYRGLVQGNFNITADSGSVRLGVPADSRFLLDATSDSGSVRSDLPVRGGAGPPTPGTAPTVRIRTASGSILIGRMD